MQGVTETTVDGMVVRFRKAYSPYQPALASGAARLLRKHGEQTRGERWLFVADLIRLIKKHQPDLIEAELLTDYALHMRITRTFEFGAQVGDQVLRLEQDEAKNRYTKSKKITMKAGQLAAGPEIATQASQWPQGAATQTDWGPARMRATESLRPMSYSGDGRFAEPSEPAPSLEAFEALRAQVAELQDQVIGMASLLMMEGGASAPPETPSGVLFRLAMLESAVNLTDPPDNAHTPSALEQLFRSELLQLDLKFKREFFDVLSQGRLKRVEDLMLKELFEQQGIPLRPELLERLADAGVVSAAPKSANGPSPQRREEAERVAAEDAAAAAALEEEERKKASAAFDEGKRQAAAVEAQRIAAKSALPKEEFAQRYPDKSLARKEPVK
jgi:hypothetical protein